MENLGLKRQKRICPTVGVTWGGDKSFAAAEDTASWLMLPPQGLQVALYSVQRSAGVLMLLERWSAPVPVVAMTTLSP